MARKRGTGSRHREMVFGRVVGCKKASGSRGKRKGRSRSLFPRCRRRGFFWFLAFLLRS